MTYRIVERNEWYAIQYRYRWWPFWFFYTEPRTVGWVLAKWLSQEGAEKVLAALIREHEANNRGWKPINSVEPK